MAVTCLRYLGRGELAIRNGTARIVVAYMKTGMSPHEACAGAMNKVHEMAGQASLNVIAFNPLGEVGFDGHLQAAPLLLLQGCGHGGD